MPRYLYQIWPGKNRFCCRKYITGPIGDWVANSYYYCCVLVVMIPYYIFVAPDLWDKVSPVLPIAATIAVLFTFVSIMLTSFTDPGIIPRKAFLMLDPVANEKYLMPNILNENGVDTRRFCSTCHIYRPERASHCSVCENCVEVFDHHCPFVNNCVGKRNYRYFISFLFSIVVAIMLILVSLIMFLLSKSGTAVNATIAIIICSVVIGGMILVLLGFLLYHVYLICSGKTTREHQKKLDSTLLSDFNWCQTDPSMVDFDKILDYNQESQITKMLVSSQEQPSTSL